MYLKNSKIIVIKIGSSLLVDENKKIRKKWLSSFARDIKKLKDKNQKIVKQFANFPEENFPEKKTLAKIGHVGIPGGRSWFIRIRKKSFDPFRSPRPPKNSKNCDFWRVRRPPSSS